MSWRFRLDFHTPKVPYDVATMSYQSRDVPRPRRLFGSLDHAVTHNGSA